MCRTQVQAVFSEAWLGSHPERFSIAYLVVSLTLFAPLARILSSSGSLIAVPVDPATLRLYAFSAISAISPLLVDSISDAVFFWEESAFLLVRIVIKASYLIFVTVIAAFAPVPSYRDIGSTLGGWQIFIFGVGATLLLFNYDRFKSFTQIPVAALNFLLYLAVMLRLINLIYQNHIIAHINAAIVAIYYLLFIALSIRWINAFRKADKVRHKDLVCITLMAIILLTVPTWILIYLVTIVYSATNAYHSSNFIGIDILLRFVALYIAVSMTKRADKHKAKEYKLEAEFKTELVKYLSHEIRNPLNIVAMSLEHLKLEISKGNFDRNFIRDSVVSLESGCCGAIEVLNELVTYEEIESGSFRLNKTTQSPFHLLERSLQAMAEITSPFGIGLHVKVREEDRETLSKMHLLADEEKIGVVMRKVISRGLYECRTGDSFNITVGLAPEKSNLRSLKISSLLPFRKKVSPHDFSTSLPGTSQRGEREHRRCGFIRIEVPLLGNCKELGEHLFAGDELRFIREGHDDEDRLGLSIWISRRIVDLHGGRMGLFCNDTARVIFIDLPYEVDLRDKSRSLLMWSADGRISVSNDDFDGDAQKLLLSATRAQDESLAGQELPKMRLLVVDDSSLYRKIIVKVMHSLGHECEEADDGLVAVELVKRRPLPFFDAILME